MNVLIVLPLFFFGVAVSVPALLMRLAYVFAGRTASLAVGGFSVLGLFGLALFYGGYCAIAEGVSDNGCGFLSFMDRVMQYTFALALLCVSGITLWVSIVTKASEKNRLSGVNSGE